MNKRLVYIQRPGLLWDTAVYRLRVLVQPDFPWLSPGAVRFCDRAFDPKSRGFEWGSGRSTIWFGRRCQTLVSIEHDPRWHARVRGLLDERELVNVDYRLVPLDHPVEAPTVPDYSPVPRYVRAIEAAAEASLDFVIVDGHYRQACVRAALSRLRPGGYLLVDNTDWLALPEWGVPSSWQIAHQSRNRVSQTTIWRKPGG